MKGPSYFSAIRARRRAYIIAAMARVMTAFRVDPEELDRIDAYAKRAGSTRSTVFREAIADYLDRHRPETSKP